jgi:hypothetical protein
LNQAQLWVSNLPRSFELLALAHLLWGRLRRKKIKICAYINKNSRAEEDKKIVKKK